MADQRFGDYLAFATELYAAACTGRSGLRPAPQLVVAIPANIDHLQMRTPIAVQAFYADAAHWKELKRNRFEQRDLRYLKVAEGLRMHPSIPLFKVGDNVLIAIYTLCIRAQTANPGAGAGPETGIYKWEACLLSEAAKDSVWGYTTDPQLGPTADSRRMAKTMVELIRDEPNGLTPKTIQVYDITITNPPPLLVAQTVYNRPQTFNVLVEQPHFGLR
jgi:hypothetical protein